MANSKGFCWNILSGTIKLSFLKCVCFTHRHRANFLIKGENCLIFPRGKYFFEPKLYENADISEFIVAHVQI